MWESLRPVGRYGPTGGYRRYSFTEADAACRQWFEKTAAERELRVDHDRNGNLWAWWDGENPDRDAIVTGSHLDSVPDGGAFDGPLGVVSAFAALDELRARGLTPRRPVGVAAFCEEEGARFGVACLGSRLLTGVLDPQAARGLTDGTGVSLAEAMTGAGLDPAAIGPDDDRLRGIAAYVELHIEQGSALAGRGAAVGLAAGIWPHGRWRVEFTGRADHAGTTRLPDRRDPMLPFAATVLAARQAAADHEALATIGKVMAEPGSRQCDLLGGALLAGCPGPGRGNAGACRRAGHGGRAGRRRRPSGVGQRQPGIGHAAGPVRRWAAGPAGRRARRARHHRAGAADRRRP